MEAANATGMAVWLTGLSGAGKSTIGRHVAARLREAGAPVLLLDGNAVRDAVADPHAGFDARSRLAAAYRMSRLARLAADQGLVAVVATISLFHEIQAWNRAHLDTYVEVYVRVPLDEVRRRDRGGVYAPARGEPKDVWGVDIPIEEPQAPDLVIDNWGPDADPIAAGERVFALALERMPGELHRALRLDPPRAVARDQR